MVDWEGDSACGAGGGATATCGVEGDGGASGACVGGARGGHCC